MNTVNKNFNHLYEDSSKRRIRLTKKTNDLSMKLERECTFSPKVNKNYNFLFSNKNESRHDILFQVSLLLRKDGSLQTIKKTLMRRDNDHNLEKNCTFSPKTNRSFRGFSDPEFKRLCQNKSNKIISQKLKVYEDVPEKKSVYDNATQERINFLYNLHKERNFSLKRLEQSVYEVLF
jgi:hypothetical protein